MRIMALLGDRVGDPLHVDRGKIEISQVFMEVLGFKVLVGERLTSWQISINSPFTCFK